ncbi:MAG: FecR domain-containing protein [Bacteroidia bacterium]|nr:FecR domain-containing protein [Bacteroidia bacterium]NNM24321.1 FecR family protein [Flavobacteriaceae bacterium]
MKQELLDKWLNGTISTSEREELRQDRRFRDYEKMDEYLRFLELPTQNTADGLSKLKSRIQLSTAKVVRFPVYLKVAAAAAILILVGYFYLDSLPVTHSTLIAETEVIQLPDRSQVFLNENSELTYQDNLWDEQRSLELHGEAFFEVAEGRDFNVLTASGIVRVLGTKFNVLARGDNFDVSCFDGEVEVILDKEKIILAAGDKLTLTGGAMNRSNQYTLRPGWIYDESSFENTFLKHVIFELENVYSIKVVPMNVDMDLRYTGSFTNTNLEDALKTITLPLDITYSIEGNHVTLLGKD